MGIILAKKDFVPIPAELDEHVDNEVGVTVELSAVVAMRILRNVHQYYKFEQMVENTCREPVHRNRFSKMPFHTPSSVIYLTL